MRTYKKISDNFQIQKSMFEWARNGERIFNIRQYFFWKVVNSIRQLKCI